MTLIVLKPALLRPGLYSQHCNTFGEYSFNGWEKWKMHRRHVWPMRSALNGSGGAIGFSIGGMLNKLFIVVFLKLLKVRLKEPIQRLRKLDN